MGLVFYRWIDRCSYPQPYLLDSGYGQSPHLMSLGGATAFVHCIAWATPACRPLPSRLAVLPHSAPALPCLALHMLYAIPPSHVARALASFSDNG